MIIFVLALLVLIGALVVNFVPSVKNNRVLIMSALAILMIMINFINEIDIIVSPPQVLIKVDSRSDGQGKKQFTKLYFKQEFESQKMRYLTETLKDIKRSLMNSFQQSSTLTQQQKKSTLQQLQTLPSSQYVKPLIKPQIYMIEQLKTRLINDQDSVIHFQGIDKERFQTLIQFYIKEINDKAQSYGHKFDKVMFVPVYEDDMNQANSKGYKWSQNLSEKHYHYVVVFDLPSEKLLEFLYEQYQQASSHMTIIFLELDQKVNIFPISRFIEHIYLPQMSYIQPITQLVVSKVQKTESKQAKQLLNKIQNQLQICEKYLEMDFKFLLRLIAYENHKTIAKICYQTLIQPISNEKKCLRDMIQKESDQIPLNRAKSCWKGKKQPDGVIFTQNEKVRLKKQYYWYDRVNATDFGLQVITKRCSNQL